MTNTKLLNYISPRVTLKITLYFLCCHYVIANLAKITRRHLGDDWSWYQAKNHFKYWGAGGRGLS